MRERRNSASSVFTAIAIVFSVPMYVSSTAVMEERTSSALMNASASPFFPTFMACAVISLRCFPVTLHLLHYEFQPLLLDPFAPRLLGALGTETVLELRVRIVPAALGARVLPAFGLAVAAEPLRVGLAGAVPQSAALAPAAARAAPVRFRAVAVAAGQGPATAVHRTPLPRATGAPPWPRRTGTRSRRSIPASRLRRRPGGTRGPRPSVLHTFPCGFLSWLAIVSAPGATRTQTAACDFRMPQFRHSNLSVHPPRDGATAYLRPLQSLGHGLVPGRLRGVEPRGVPDVPPGGAALGDTVSRPAHVPAGCRRVDREELSLSDDHSTSS